MPSSNGNEQEQPGDGRAKVARRQIQMTNIGHLGALGLEDGGALLIRDAAAVGRSPLPRSSTVRALMLMG